MDLYTLLKLLHVVAAIVWVGGGLSIMVAATLAHLRHDDEGMLRVFSTVPELGRLWFMPASMLTLLSGIAVTTVGGLWSQLWIVLALGGIAATILTGILVFEPMGKQIGAFLAEGRTADAVAVARRIMRIARFDYALMFVIVADMVLKPGYGDWIALGALGAIVAIAAIAFLLPRRSQRPAVA